MKRCILFIAVLTVVLGAAGIVGQAQAKAPGPNGRILFVQDTRTCDDCHLTSINPDGTAPVRIEQGSIGRWSPDGDRISAVAGTADGRVGTILMDPDGTNVTPLAISDATLNLACAAWSPEGGQLLCEGWDDVHPHRAPGLFGADPSTGDIVRITSNPYGGHDIPADYSPDGTQILFLRENPTRKHRPLGLFVADVDGTGAIRVSPWLNDSGCCQASWSPDGSLILFASKGALRTVASDGTGLAKISLDTGEGFAFAFGPGWSPDGTRMVFCLYLEATQQVDLYTAAADGTDLVQLTDSRRGEDFPDWGPNVSPGA